MDEEERIRRLWAYYLDLARQRGLLHKRVTAAPEQVDGAQLPEGAQPPEAPQLPRDKQANYSMWWFYLDHTDRRTGAPTGLNDLSRAFLGDQAAMAALEWRPEAGEQGWGEGDIDGLQAQPRDCCLEGSEPNPSQQRAISLALTQPISFIKGPPGTGKTATILNLLSCIAQNKADDGQGGTRRLTAAVLSNNNSALENIAQDIEDFGDHPEPNQKKLKDAFAVLGSAARRADFEEESRRYEDAGRRPFAFSGGTQKYYYCPGSDFPQCCETPPVDPQHPHAPPPTHVASVNRESGIRAEEFLAEYPIITSTVHSLQNCFANGTGYQYDYVIIDECSQLDTIVGLTAMRAAKHLVLVGDSDQLPPVLNEEDVARLNDSDIAQAVDEQDRALHLLAEGWSFLDACMKCFDAPFAKVTLDVHYRCAPGIFEFCNRYVYTDQATGEGAITIHTQTHRKDETDPEDEDGYNVPIKVLWFEGNYCVEGYPASKQDVDFQAAQRDGRGHFPRSIRRNQKQVYIFLEEELPYIEEFLARQKRRGKDASICILTPFLGMLHDLRQGWQNYGGGCEQWAKDHDLNSFVWSDQGEQLTTTAQNSEQEDNQEPPALVLRTSRGSTVHKAQGRQFDIVYLLPVEDGTWKWPWSQGKRLVNVAVSRAKRELRIIASSSLMDEDTQNGLEQAGLLQGKYVKRTESRKEANERRQIQTSQRSAEDEEAQELYIQKLVTYVRQTNRDQPSQEQFRQTPQYLPAGHPHTLVTGFPRSDDGYPFGFHKTQLVSIFDRVPYLKTLKYKTTPGQPRMSAPEQCLYEALTGLPLVQERALRLHREVPLWDILEEALGEELDQRLDWLFENLDDRPRAWQSADDLKAYCRRSRIDFLVCDDQDRVLLVLEVDGEHHQHHRFWYNAVREEASEYLRNADDLPHGAEHANKFMQWVRAREERHRADPTAPPIRTDDGDDGTSDHVLEALREMARSTQSRRDPWDKFPYQQLVEEWSRKRRDDYARRDRAKNQLFDMLLHATLYEWGNRRGLYDLPDGVRLKPTGDTAFTLLRLPKDGSTSLEIRSLWEQAPAELREKFFPMEELLEQRLEAPREDEDYIYYVE